MAGTQHRATRGSQCSIMVHRVTALIVISERVSSIGDIAKWLYRRMIQSDDTYTHLRTLYNATFLNK